MTLTVARSTLSFAGIWMISGIKEVIFEYNEIKPGGASPSWGNNIVRSHSLELDSVTNVSHAGVDG